MAIEMRELVRVEREKRGWGQRQMATECGEGWDQAKISRIESGVVHPGFDDLVKLADVLGLRLDKLVDLRARVPDKVKPTPRPKKQKSRARAS